MCYEVTFTVHCAGQLGDDDCPDISFALEMHNDELQAIADYANRYNTDPALIIQALLSSGFRLVMEAASGAPFAEEILAIQIANSKATGRQYEIVCDICERQAVCYSKPRDDQLSICDHCASTKKRQLGRAGFQEWAKGKWREKQHSLRTPKL